MSEITYNPMDHSEERIERYYNAGNICVNSLTEDIFDVYIDARKVNSMQNCIKYLEDLIAFNCWNNHDISSWATTIEQAKAFLETHSG